MVAELSALQQIINALTGLDGLPALIVEAVVTAIYTGKSQNHNSQLSTNYDSLGGVSYLIHYR